jgi:hypothetical protein
MQQYRNELGYLTIVDPQRLHVIRMPHRGEMQWQWRLHVPEANRFAVTVGTGMVPKEGFHGMRSGGSLPLPAGETIVHASVFRDYRGRLVFRVERTGAAFKTELKGEHADWLNSSGWSSAVAGSGGTEMASPGEPFALLRFRGSEEIKVNNKDGSVSTGWQAPNGPSTGLMAWITDSGPPEARRDGADSLDSPTREN